MQLPERTQVYETPIFDSRRCAVPATAVLGAILLTGYLGGAVAVHLRVGNPLATHTLFPIYFGIAIWGGLHLRDARVRALTPVRSVA